MPERTRILRIQPRNKNNRGDKTAIIGSTVPSRVKPLIAAPLMDAKRDFVANTRGERGSARFPQTFKFKAGRMHIIHRKRARLS